VPGSRPPLNALHVFCAVVRAGGFRQAAEHLCVTPGAVSRQIAVLEARLGEALFERGARVALTAAGRRLHDRVASRLEAVCAALEANSPRGLRVASILVDTGVTFAMHWLIPNLRAFEAQHPQLDVKVRTAGRHAEPADVYIRRDVAELQGLPAQVFMTERSVLVAGPSFAQRPRVAARGGSLRWLAGVPRIGARSRPDLWPQWTEHHGLHGPGSAPTLEFDNTVLAIQAAAQGLGVCVLPEVFVHDMLGSSTLRLLHPSRVPTGTYSMAVARRHSPLVARFTAWLETAGKSHS
jgi:LysR family transcriptional regulator, glycine cleavage system transcriptional activator